MTMYSQTLLLQLKGTYKPPTATHHNLAAGLSRATFPRPQLSCSCCGSCFVLLSLLSVWLQLFILSFPTNNSSSISSVNPSWVLALPPSSPTQSNDVRTARLLSWRWEGVLDRDYKGTGSVKIPYWLTHQRPPSPSFSVNGKGGARRREGRKEEMTNWENYFAICGTCCEWAFQGGGKVVFPWAHAERLCGPRSKLSPCWKITTLHDR